LKGQQFALLRHTINATMQLYYCKFMLPQR